MEEDLNGQMEIMVFLKATQSRNQAGWHKSHSPQTCPAQVIME